MTDFMDRLYDARDYELAAFGEHWCGPGRIPRDWTLIARYPKDPEDGDGQAVEVDCSALPARFTRIRVLPGVNSCNEPQEGYSVTFGSSQQELTADIAKAISQGMLTFCKELP